MNSISTLNNNLDTLKLMKIKENINTYLDLIADGKKTTLDALIELTSLELEYKQDLAITSCVKVANFPFLKEIKDFDFSYQPSIDKRKIMDLMTLRFIDNYENIIFCGTPGVGKCICQPKTEPLHQFKNEPPTNDIKYGRWLICLVVNF